MQIKLCKLIDFNKILCTIHDEELHANLKQHRPFFFVKSAENEFQCLVEESLSLTDNLIQFKLRIASKLRLKHLKEKLELYMCLENSIQKKKIKKIDILDHYAEKVKNIVFFPEINDKKTTFKLFSPFASEVKIKFIDVNEYEMRPMKYHKEGYWSYSEPKNLHLQQYRYVITIEGRTIETIDPFSLSLTENSTNSAVIDFKQIKTIKEHRNSMNICDSILYETHIRDFTSDPETAFTIRNSYKAFTQRGITKNCFPAGLDHLIELGITHVHLLPVQDFNSVDELHKADYNWGYDPKCYSVPEGSYSSDPQNPLSRVEEFSEMVNTLHEENIGVILDVVYNHTYDQYDSIFNNILPDYCYRWNMWGDLSNGSGCGNEIATENIFIRKYIIDTLRHWISNYKVDGFRFDLMGLIDRDTMFLIEEALLKERKDIILYGEPWTGGNSTLPDNKRSLKGFQRNHRIAIFNDDLRNGIKGFPDDTSKGFVSGDLYWTNNVLGSMLGGFGYEEELVNISENPREQVVYSSCHDNLTLFDKLKISCPDENWDSLLRMNKLSAFIYLLSFGVPFIHSGEEFARTKFLHPNTYNAGDIYNAIKWGSKEKYNDLYRYYKNVLAIRKKHPLFRLNSKKEVTKRVNLIHSIDGAFLYSINGIGIDEWEYAIIAVNMTADDLWFKLPEIEKKEWTIIINPFQSGESPLGIACDELLVGEKSWYLLYLKR